MDIKVMQLKRMAGLFLGGDQETMMIVQNFR